MIVIYEGQGEILVAELEYEHEMIREFFAGENRVGQRDIEEYDRSTAKMYVRFEPRVHLDVETD